MAPSSTTLYSTLRICWSLLLFSEPTSNSTNMSTPSSLMIFLEIKKRKTQSETMDCLAWTADGEMESSLGVSFLFGCPLQELFTADELPITQADTVGLVLLGKRERNHLARVRHSDGGSSSSTQLQGIYFWCHKVWFKGLVFLLNKDHVDCLDTWNPVVLRLQLWGQNQILLSWNKQVLFLDIRSTTKNLPNHKLHAWSL